MVSDDTSLPLIRDNDTNGTQNALIRAANHSSATTHVWS